MNKCKQDEMRERIRNEVSWAKTTGRDLERWLAFADDSLFYFRELSAALTDAIAGEEDS